MKPKNNYFQVEPIKKGLIVSSDGNFYKILAMNTIGEYHEYNVGDQIIIEDQLVVKLTIDGVERYFCNHENILAIANEPPPNS